MDSVRELYGIAYLSTEEQLERTNNDIFRIEYYKVKEERCKIEIVKKSTKECIESKTVELIQTDENKIHELFETLIRNKVTPTTIEYILEDLNYNSIGMV